MDLTDSNVVLIAAVEKLNAKNKTENIISYYS